MEFDEDKVDEMVLALLFLTTYKDKSGLRTWKGYDWDSLNRLHEKDYISYPKGRNKSVAVYEEGYQLSKKLFYKYFNKLPNKAM